MSVPPPINVVAEDPEERGVAAVAHASILLNFFAPGLGIIAAGAVWLTQRGRSAFAAKQALQATIFQLVWSILPIAMVIVGIVMALGGIGFAALAQAELMLVVLIPLLAIGVLVAVCILLLGPLYALVAAYEVYRGRDFRYWLVGKMIH